MNRNLLSLCIASAIVQGTALAEPTNTAATASDSGPTITVQAERLSPLSASVVRKELRDATLSLSAAAIAQRAAGVAAGYRAIDAPEISIRGLGWERVPAQLDFLPLYGSCPARMDPAAACVTPESIDSLTVIKGLPSVSLGSGGTGGRVMMRSVTDLTQPVLDGSHAHGALTWTEGRSGWNAQAGTQLGNGTLEAGFSGSATDYGDYTSGSGQRVPAASRSYGATATLRLRPDANNGYFGSWNLHKVNHLDHPALPMDATDVTVNTFTFGGQHAGAGDRLETVEWQAGYSVSDHSMDNALKPNRARMETEAITESETIGARIASALRFSEASRWLVGADAHRLARDGTRTRLVMMAPPRPGNYRDPIWPDATQDQVGLFAERTSEMRNGTRLRLGLRADHIASAIGRGDEPTPFDATVRDGYARYYGDDARDTDRGEWLGSGNIVWTIPQGESIEWFLSVGRVQRAAGVTERFYAYAPAPGGFAVGNPTLDPETKSEIDVGMDFFGDRVELSVHLFASHVSDYILETGIDSAPNGAWIRGFVNADARLVGGEVQGRWLLSDAWSIPFGVATVSGRNLDSHSDLPLIPPLSGRVGGCAGPRPIAHVPGSSPRCARRWPSPRSIPPSENPKRPPTRSLICVPAWACRGVSPVKSASKTCSTRTMPNISPAKRCSPRATWRPVRRSPCRAASSIPASSGRCSGQVNRCLLEPEQGKSRDPWVGGERTTLCHLASSVSAERSAPHSHSMK
ncbi:MAG: TonB-dependent receptor [Verrucomicrobia bacterium]|jgi:iron complex outermembrane recepter protein|nr:TonB-dependent receptor [Verrucomicrobiota bacterium]MBT7066261.1 TonB-dependent receptor [Verrucomicrobiota bacterium]MBT7700250.1 TonB-dependent receptor [Verrucomicrobiota bacterium]